MNLDAHAFRVLGWVGVLLLAAAAVYLAAVEQWQGAAAMAGFCGGSIALILIKDKLPSLFSFLVVLAALTNGAGWVWNLFNNKKILWYDEVVHGFTMAVIGLAVAFYLHYQKSYGAGRSHPGTRFVIRTTLAALLIGVGWEGVEWIFNMIGTIWDTFLDLVMDTLGGLVAGFFAAQAIRNNPPHQLREGRAKE